MLQSVQLTRENTENDDENQHAWMALLCIKLDPSCGANFNGLGPNAGITIVGGHEMGETITDQFPSSGWLDSGGAENGDKCASISSGQGASANVKLSTGTFAVQSLWSNGFNGGAGGCVLSDP